MMGFFDAASGSVFKEYGAEKQSTNENIPSFTLFNCQNWDHTWQSYWNWRWEIVLVTITKIMERLGAISNREQIDFALSADIGGLCSR